MCDEIYTQGYSVIDSFLPQQDYEDLLFSAQAMHAEGHFRSARIGRQLDTAQHSEIRGDKIFWLNESENKNTAIDNYLSQINRLARALNQAFYLGLEQFETHFAVYPPKTFYKKHIDQFKTAQDRRISCVYYLNEQWQDTDGGQLKLYSEQDKLVLSLLPLANRFICFKSDLAHEVEETQRTRYSIAGWLKVRNLSLTA